MPPKKSSRIELSDKTVETLSERPIEEKVPLEEINRKLLFFGIIVTVFTVLVSGGVYFMATKVTPQNEVQQVIVENAPEIKVQPESLERSEISLEILNGTGIAKEAARVANVLKEQGYGSVSIGNSERSVINTIHAKADMEGKLVVLVNDLKVILGDTLYVYDLVDTDLTARIILGQ